MRPITHIDPPQDPNTVAPHTSADAEPVYPGGGLVAFDESWIAADEEEDDDDLGDDEDDDDEDDDEDGDEDEFDEEDDDVIEGGPEE